MTRTFKSKDAQRLHRGYSSYSKAFGHDWDYASFTEEVIGPFAYNQFGCKIIPIVDKRSIFENNYYVTGEKPLYYFTRSTMLADDRRYDNKSFRGKNKRMIHAFMRGEVEDVVMESRSPRMPRHFWF